MQYLCIWNKGTWSVESMGSRRLRTSVPGCFRDILCLLHWLACSSLRSGARIKRTHHLLWRLFRLHHRDVRRQISNLLFQYRIRSSSVIVHRIDPRDIVWEEPRPTYRVYLWRLADKQRYSDEYQIEGADSVNDILEWATRQCQGDAGLQFALYVVSPKGPGLLRLAGECPT